MDAATKTWTPEQATKSLPLVRRIAEDILDDGRRLMAIANKDDVDESEREEAEAIYSRLEGFMEELDTLGCHWKGHGFETALVDFPGELDGRPVLLCWQLGEDRVEYYHDEETGFDGRQPIPARQA